MSSISAMSTTAPPTPPEKLAFLLATTTSTVEMQDAVRAVVDQVDHLYDQALAQKEDEEKRVGGEIHPSNGGDQMNSGAPLLPGAARRRDYLRSDAEEGAFAQPATPGSAADVNLALTLASSPIVREQSEEALAAIQPAAARWRRAMAKLVAVGRFGTAAASGDGGGGDGEGGGEEGKEKNDAQIIAREEEEEEEGPLIELIPPELLCIVFALLDAKTLMTVVPRVCKGWRSACQEHLCNVHLDFSWVGWEKVPLEVLAGWPLQLQTPLMVAEGGGGGGSGSANPADAEQQAAAGVGDGWASGMCEVFSRTTSVTMGHRCEAEDVHVMTLADKCRGLTHAHFAGSYNLTDAAVLALADKRRGLKHAEFGGCENLTDAALRALADKCPELTHAYFRTCTKLTDAALLALADKCRGLKHADFNRCNKLTDVAVLALADKCHGLKLAGFGYCMKLTDATVVALADKCPELEHADFSFCKNLTDAAVIALADKCPELEWAIFQRCRNLTDATKAAVQVQLPNCNFRF